MNREGRIIIKIQSQDTGYDHKMYLVFRTVGKLKEKSIVIHEKKPYNECMENSKIKG